MSYIGKKTVLILLLSCCGGQIVAAAPFSESSSGGHFVKRIAYNFLANGLYNFAGKTEVEKLFFGDFNAKLEFFVALSFEGAYGFRIVRDTLEAMYSLEVKRIANFDEVTAQLSKEHFSTYEKQKEEAIKRYEVYTQVFPVGNSLADELYDKVAAAIANFKGKKNHPVPIDGYNAVTILTDGYTVTFRCVVEDEVQMLAIHMPKGALSKLADICNLLIKDAEANLLYEEKYIRLLRD